MIKDCTVCGSEQPHALVEGGTSIACNRCGVRSWPSEPSEGAQQAGRDRMLGLWRSAVQAVTAAADAAREAEERTAAIDAGRAPAPVVEGEPDGVFVFAGKERGKC